MHKPKVYVERRDPDPKLAVGMVQSCESRAPAREAGLKCQAGWSPLLPALKQACAIAKGLFDAFKVVPLPTLPCPLFLRGRDASAFHAQLSLSTLVNEGQCDGGKVPCGKAEGGFRSSVSTKVLRLEGKENILGMTAIHKQCLLTLWPRLKPPLHRNMFLRNLK